MLAEKKVILMNDGTEIFCEIREANSPLWLVGVHGIGEHLGRHQYIPELFSQYFNILQFDLRGHGKSQGQRGYIHNFEQFFNDLEEILFYLRDQYKMKDYILFGHSMGALISAGFLQTKASFKKGTYPVHTFLSAPPVAVAGPHGKLLYFMPQIAKGLYKLPLNINLPKIINPKNLSHDIQLINDFDKDKLILTSLNFKLLNALVNTANEVFHRPLRSLTPLSVAVGSADPIVNVDTIRHYFQKIEKTANYFEVKDAYHELHNEIDRYKKPYFQFLKTSLKQTASFIIAKRAKENMKNIKN